MTAFPSSRNLRRRTQATGPAGPLSARLARAMDSAVSLKLAGETSQVVVSAA
ncbi:hypothetical protein [Streptomyces sp. NPDC060031]|uniref:hypothetical protein n=1 Tax=Streptomyces sp. NPDC060031 TaxID=3347043 RepID=UPI0036900AB4